MLIGMGQMEDRKRFTQPVARILTIIVVPLLMAHLIGSYAVELFDAVENPEFWVAMPAIKLLLAPVSIIPGLIRISRQFIHEGRSGEMMIWWLAYLLPFGATFSLCQVAHMLARRKPRLPKDSTVGFPVELTAEPARQNPGVQAVPPLNALGRQIQSEDSRAG